MTISSLVAEIPIMITHVYIETTPLHSFNDVEHIHTHHWLSARLQYLQCVSNGDTAVLHQVIAMPSHNNSHCEDLIKGKRLNLLSHSHTNVLLLTSVKCSIFLWAVANWSRNVNSLTGSSISLEPGLKDWKCNTCSHLIISVVSQNTS